MRDSEVIGRTTRRGGFAPAFVVNPEVAEEVMRHHWVSTSKGRYLSAAIDGKMVQLHRYVYRLTHGTEPKIVDHINRNRLDCRAENLREASPSLSNLNRSHSRGKYPPGVGFHPKAKSRPYQASARRSGKTVHLGYFPTAIEASTAVANFRLSVV